MPAPAQSEPPQPEAGRLVNVESDAAADGNRTSLVSRRVLFGGAFASLLIVGACATTWRSGALQARHSPRGVSLAASGIVNLDVTLANLPNGALTAQARDEVEDELTAIFEGKLPDCEVSAEVIPSMQKDAASTIAQVTLVPEGDETVDDLAIFVESDQEMQAISLMIEDAIDTNSMMASFKTGEVTVAEMEEGQQAGDLQHTIVDISAGSDTIPMGSTTFRTGDTISIDAGDDDEEEVAVVSKASGTLTVSPALAKAYPRGSSVILVKRISMNGEACDKDNVCGQGLVCGANAVCAPVPPPPAPVPPPPAPVPEPPAPAPAPPQTVTHKVILSNLPSGNLDPQARAQVEDHVENGYCKTLGMDKSQVSASVTNRRLRRLRNRGLEQAQPDSTSSTETHLDVTLRPSAEQSADDVTEALNEARDDLDQVVLEEVGKVPGIQAMATDDITAACGHDPHPVPAIPPIVLYAAAGVCAVGLLGAIAAFFMKKSAREPGMGGPWLARDEPSMIQPKPSQPAHSWLGGHETEPTGGAPLLETHEADFGHQEMAHSDPERESLIRQVFAKFDVDRDNALNEVELRTFAKICCDFSGNDEEWALEYEAICQEFLVRVTEGIEYNHFKILVDDQQLGLDPEVHDDAEAVSGLYCSDEDLRHALAAPLPAAMHAEALHAVAPPEAPPTSSGARGVECPVCGHKAKPDARGHCVMCGSNVR